ncbi:adhesin [Streptomyces sp. bgisy100]|uniref:adhesin n=1 Tax=Streptomyces sp. bgisy100 TaxID=3413783 RepID=UPI003D7298EF
MLTFAGVVGLTALVVSSTLFAGSAEPRTASAADPDLREPPKPTLILPSSGPSDEPPGEPGDGAGDESGDEEPSDTEESGPSATDAGHESPGEPGEKDPVTYSAWAGHGCTAPEGGGYAEYGRHVDGIEGWYTVSSGGYEGGACDGSFSAVPMSGSSTEDSGSRALWWWTVGEDSDACAIEVYIPTSADGRDVAGDPTLYNVLADPGEPDSAYDSFLIDQTLNRGHHVDAGTYEVKDGRLGVELVDRGQNWNDYGTTYAHHAAAQMKVTCRE